MILGITGGIGSGKSTVLGLLEQQYQAVILPLDLVGRELMKKGKEAYQAVIDAFGTEILDEQDEIDRSLLARYVFSDAEKLKKLESIIHPLVKEKTKEFIAQNKDRFVVLESAILFETGYQTLCDETWYVYAKDIIRVKRLMKDRGYTLERIERTFKKQMSDREFRIKSDRVIDNSGSIQETQKQVIDCMAKLSELV